MRNISLAVAVGLISVVVGACSSAPSDSGFGAPGASPSSGGSAQTPNGTSSSGSGGFGSSGGASGGADAGGGGATGTGATGQVDKTAACDSGLQVDGDAAAFAKALGICSSATTDGFGLVSASYSKAYGSTTAPHAGQWGLLPRFGSAISPREGGTLGVLSSGYAREYDNLAGTNGGASSAFVAGQDLAGHNYPTGAAPPGFPKAAGGCAQDNKVNDMIDVKLTLKAPMDATGFQFDFNFYSSEWPNYVCSNFNDAFVAYLGSSKLTDNISFDAKGNPVAVNNGYFDRCTSAVPVGCQRSNGGPWAPDPPLSTSACAGGTAELAGTGYAFTDQTLCDSGNQDATLGGATGWLTTVAPIQPGETFTLDLMIWDAGDGQLDSSVLLDNFQWIGGAVAPAAPQTSRVN